MRRRAVTEHEAVSNPKPAGQLYRATQAFQFDIGGQTVSVHEGMVIYDFARPAHPYRKGREYFWRVLTIMVDLADGMPELPDEVAVNVEAHAPAGVMADDPADDFWAFARIRVRTGEPRLGDVFAPEDPRPLVGVNARGPSPFTSNYGPKVASLFSRRRKLDAAISEDVDTAAEYEPAKAGHHDVDGNLVP